MKYLSQSVAFQLVFIVAGTSVVGADRTLTGWWQVLEAQEHGEDISGIKGSYVLVTKQCVVIVQHNEKAEFRAEIHVDADAWSLDFKTMNQADGQIIGLTKDGMGITILRSKEDRGEATMRLFARNRDDNARNSKPTIRLVKISETVASEAVRNLLGTRRFRLTQISIEAVEKALEK